jgi:hypothetical protein
LKWAKNAEEDMKKTSSKSFGNLRNANIYHVLEVGIA